MYRSILHEHQSGSGHCGCAEYGVTGVVATLNAHDWQTIRNCTTSHAIALTFSHVPTQVPQAIPGVECEGQSEEEFAGIFDALWKSGHKVYDVSRVKSTRRDQVSD